MLRFWELSPSPNSVKVRMALRYKGIEFEAIPVDPLDRAPLREISGQDLSPVIEDRGIVLNDSEAILQYLDANYPSAPRLFPADRSRKQCEAWKLELDSEIVPTWLPVMMASRSESKMRFLTSASSLNFSITMPSSSSVSS